MNKPRSLFIGRWQPLHNGHIYIINKVLAEGRNVLIAVRDTPISDKNPFTVEERIKRIRETFPDEERVAIMVIEDIDQVCYGRNVGWEIREISVPQDIAEISATKTREKMRKEGKL